LHFGAVLQEERPVEVFGCAHFLALVNVLFLVAILCAILVELAPEHHLALALLLCGSVWAELHEHIPVGLGA
jgi:hypothetical protein